MSTLRSLMFSVDTVPASISLSAITVGLSSSHSSVGRLPPVASWRALFAANIINSYLVLTFSKQSSTVILAIFNILLSKGRAF